jgi:hypothetical protein
MAIIRTDYHDLDDEHFGRNVVSQNVTNKFREAFEAYAPNTPDGVWLETKASGDIIVVDGNAVGCSYLDISKDPLTADTVSIISTVQPFEMPFEASVGLSLSQRTQGQDFGLEFGSDTLLPVRADLAISSIQQVTTTLTVSTTTAHGLVPGDRICIYGVTSDSRFNYGSLTVATIPSTVQFTTTGGATVLPSVTAGPFATGFVRYKDPLSQSAYGTSEIFENATVTNAAFYIRSGGSDAFPGGGTLTGNQSVTIGTTASVQAINSAFTYAFQPTNEYRLNMQSDRVQWTDAVIDNVAASIARVMKNQLTPPNTEKYKLRFSARNTPSLSIPVGQIVTAVKSGTTTATITMDRAHGLTTADVVVVYGIRDQAASSFPNLLTATAVASVVDAVTFTIVIGTAATVTSYGGLVARVNGGNLPSALGYNAVVAQSVTRTSDVLTITGNTTWAGLVIGDYVNLYGCRANLTGASLGIDGKYKVANFATTALTLIPVGDQPTGQPNITATDAGGAIIKRTCMRISFARVFDYERERIEFVPRPAGDISASLPVAITGGTLPAVTTVTTVSTVSSVTAIVGASIAEDAAATANPLIVGGVVRTAAAPIVTPVAGDSMRFTTTTDGRLIISPYQYPEACWQYAAAASGIVNTTTAVTIKAAAGASLRNYITGIDLKAEALTNATEIAIRDGAGGTVIWRTKISTGGLLAGRSITFPTPITGTAATLLEVVTLTASGAGAVYFNATGFVAP